MYEDILLVLLAIIAFIVLVRLADRKGWIKKYGMSAYGPFLMLKTQRGKRFIDWLARPKKFWEAYAIVSKWLCLVVMFLMMALLIWEATIVSSIPAEAAPGPEMILGIPGINPIIPLWYGILGLVVAIFIHEFAHGILTRVGNMTIRSMGIILLIVPMGAFVEPDEEALVKTEKRKRMNVYAVGPATNIIVGLVCALVFSSAMMASLEPVRDNPIVVSVGDDSPADLAGLNFGAQIIEMGGQEITSYDDYFSFAAPDPGQTVNVTYYYKGESLTAEVTSGVVLTQVSGGYPADDAGLEAGMIIYSLNDTVIRNDNDLTSVLKLTVGGQTINVTALSYDEDLGQYVTDPLINTITLTSRRDYYQAVSPGSIGDDFLDYGFMGINSAYMGAGVNTPDVILDRLATPYEGADDFGSIVTSSLRYVAMPFSGLAPVQSSVADLFEAQGIWGALPADVFWILANSAYWIFWINLMVGLTNVLPAVPLDGGFLFRDGIDSLVKRFKKGASDEERVKYVGTITYVLAMFVLFLIVWQIIGPRLFG
ncbi:MAG: site-2 protease family protein [Methanomassiliicoccales archaeon]|nr:site-2 protease family protein [Methanomassiliicoccales archaeon]